jgi:TolB protein
MRTRIISVFVIMLVVLGIGALLIPGQEIRGVIKQGDKPAIAVPDFRGAGEAQRFMDTFNATLWDQLAGSGVLKMVAKSYYPLEVPQQPQDFKAPTTLGSTAPAAPGRRGDAPKPQSNGPWLTDWSNPPVSANDLAFGYTAVQNGQLVLRGWLYNLAQPDPQSAQVIGKIYFGTLDAEGAKKVAREFAADILQFFGAKSLAGTKIYFVSDRSGAKEIWSMDYDGSNQRELTHYKSVSTMPTTSADGRLFAFTTYAQGNPKIMVYSADTDRRLPFINPVSSAVETPEFTPDGRRIMFAASLEGWVQICIADTNGGGMRRISHVRAIEVSPKINPKNANDVVFISGRGGSEQLWRMNIDGGDLEMLTSGQGYVANPSWSPSGQLVAFAWTLGYEPGNYNIFVMDVASKKYVQLTHGSGRNENPWWAPDGVHLVFSSKQRQVTQLYTMLADGTGVQQLTTQGNNIQPVWSKAISF